MHVSRDIFAGFAGRAMEVLMLLPSFSLSGVVGQRWSRPSWMFPATGRDWLLHLSFIHSFSCDTRQLGNFDRVLEVAWFHIIALRRKHMVRIQHDTSRIQMIVLDLLCSGASICFPLFLAHEYWEPDLSSEA